ncbi:MAG: IS200/IS605 family transposase [Candidatus Sericytochromatia bacterium]
MSEHIFRKHNKIKLMYHIVCPAKYRKKIFTDEIEKSLKDICVEIQERYEIIFIEIGSDNDHVHFLVQSIPSLSVASIVKIIKGITSRELFKRHKFLKKELWGGNLWTSGYYANTVGDYGNAEAVKKYIFNQGKEKEYKQLFRNDKQLNIFDDYI